MSVAARAAKAPAERLAVIEGLDVTARQQPSKLDLAG
jgi:hypothetical protein